jgi:hypothetical protein
MVKQLTAPPLSPQEALTADKPRSAKTMSVRQSEDIGMGGLAKSALMKKYHFGNAPPK